MDQAKHKKSFDIRKRSYSKSVNEDIRRLTELVSKGEEGSDKEKEARIPSVEKKSGFLRLFKKEKRKESFKEHDGEFEKTGIINGDVKPKKILSKRAITHRKIVAWTTIVVILGIIAISLSGVAYANKFLYENKVFPGVTVWGDDVGGKTMNQVQELITKKIKNRTITITGPDQIYQAKADDIGLIFNTETMALSAYSKGRTSSFFGNYLTRFHLLCGKIPWLKTQGIVKSKDLEILPSYIIDTNKLSEYTEEISKNINISARDSQVSVSSGTITLIPAVYGREVSLDKLNEDILSAVEDFGEVNIKISTNQIEPDVVDDSAEDTIVQAENIMNKEVVLTYQGEKYSPNKETIASWITFTKNVDDIKYTLVIDTEKMSNYLSFLETEINIAAINKKIRVENSVKETVTQEGKDGLAIDTASLKKIISDGLTTKTSVTTEVPTYVVKPKTEYEQITVADWEKYIDINISTQTMTAYLKGGVFVGGWKVTTGNSYHSTPIGTWLVQGKSAVTRMTGGTPGVDYYDLPNVHWVTWFKGGGYSIHEAYWRSTFGGSDYVYNGSHGCVNATYDVAKFIYDWAPVGTPVIVHY